jgi:hypothetical protein
MDRTTWLRDRRMNRLRDAPSRRELTSPIGMIDAQACFHRATPQRARPSKRDVEARAGMTGERWRGRAAGASGQARSSVNTTRAPAVSLKL